MDPVKEVEALGRAKGFSEDNRKFVNVSLGQGQEPIAERGLQTAAQSGGWVFLQNIHLMAKWLPKLEKLLLQLSMSPHPDFRVYLSAEPPANPHVQSLPLSIVQTSIKVTNEPPQDFKANLSRAFANYSPESLEQCSRVSEYKSILFSLCFFHALVLGRRKFGPQGWSRVYNFNDGDLLISSDVLFNYLENNVKVPWEDLRYIFGEIMYGGHITDDWDRRLCRTYLELLMREELFDDMEMAPGLTSPKPMSYQQYKEFIDTSLPPESPELFLLHPNAEIGFLTQQSTLLFSTILELQPRQVGGSGGMSMDEKVAESVEGFLTSLPSDFEELSVDEPTPFASFVLQECGRMNILLKAIRSSLAELDLGLKGELTMSERMDALKISLFQDKVPDVWAAAAYPSLKPLAPWWVQCSGSLVIY
uniref:Dynein heavy chain n=1 Tax=Palpitomonas bilix TaxID=652834 RepID=A0A7S3DEZ9_9EUKA|mmetsp:Transcript_3413/g.6721  ORF Transcript_3413/g.6721 Transcript_3413/m.6721 type:complete len:419 (+) Transcript_3413:2-1258(+)